MPELPDWLQQYAARDGAFRSPPMPETIPAVRNNWAVPAPSSGYLTSLDNSDESKFQDWVKSNNVPFDPSPKADYDMRGYWKDLTSGGGHAATGMNANDGQMHFGDYFKTPYHKSFSNESKWATKNAPSWNEKDQLVDPHGNVVFDERAEAAKQRQSSTPGGLW